MKKRFQKEKIPKNPLLSKRVKKFWGNAKRLEHPRIKNKNN